ncbi:hypothetical protein QTN25_008872 [Entamoeba marina]
MHWASIYISTISSAIVLCFFIIVALLLYVFIVKWRQNKYSEGSVPNDPFAEVGYSALHDDTNLDMPGAV